MVVAYKGQYFLKQILRVDAQVHNHMMKCSHVRKSIQGKPGCCFADCSYIAIPVLEHVNSCLGDISNVVVEMKVDASLHCPSSIQEPQGRDMLVSIGRPL